jgi:hypothetical protein
MIYSYAISSLSNLVQESNLKNQDYEKGIEYLKELADKYNLNNKLFMKISRYLRFKNTLKHIDNYILLNELPLSTRNDLMFHMYYEVITSFTFFKNFNNLDFINKVILSMKLIRLVKNDLIIKEGDLVEEEFFVKSGLLSLKFNDYK